MTGWRPSRAAINGYIRSGLCIVAATAFGWPLSHFAPAGSIVLLYLIATLYTAIAYGLGASLFACVLGVACFDFFFLLPYYTLYIADPADVVRVAVFAIVAVVVSNLAARVRQQALNADQRAKTNDSLYQLSRHLSRAVTLADVLHATSAVAGPMLQGQVVLLLADGDTLTAPPEGAPADLSDPAVAAAARACLTHGRPAEAVPAPDATSVWRFLSMHAGRGIVGVVAFRPQPTDRAPPADREQLLGAVVDQAAQAIERVRLGEDLDRASRAAERDHLHAALLTSISHDLRTPLASILGSASNLVDSTIVTDETARVELAQTIRDEAERLNRFISNLLDMTRLESGMLLAAHDPVDLIDVVGAALERCGRIVAHHIVRVELPSDLPMLAVDEVLLEHVLFNLLDNAAKDTPPASLIQIKARRNDRCIVLQVIDEGDGIPAVDLDRIFDKFYRVPRQDRRRAGTGLGLAICRGFVTAMGGQVTAGNRSDRSGAVFTVTLPVPPGRDLPDLDSQ